MAQRSHSRICGTLLSVVAFCTTAFAGGCGDIPCGSAPGVVNEFSANAANFTVQITRIERQSAEAAACRIPV